MDPYTVLYVDDEPDLLSLGKAFLENFGDFSVDTAGSPEEGLEILKKTAYDAVISDYQMPGTDGLAFLRMVREQFGDLPFILFTGRGREAVVIEAIDLGVDFYLQKGGDVGAQFAELAHKIKKAVERKRAIDEQAASEKRLSALFHASPIHQMITEYSSGRIMDINDRFLRDLSISREQALGKTPDEIGLFTSPEQTGPVYLQLEKSGIVRNVPLNIRNRAGELFTSLVSMTMVEVHGRRLVYTQSMDVTALNKARQTINALLNAPPDTSMLLDLEGRILAANRAASSRFEIPEKELIGRNAFDLISPNLAGLRREKVAMAASTGKPLVYTDNRTGRTYENHLYPVLDAAGTVTAVAVYSNDVTEEVMAKQALRESEEKYRLVVEHSHDTIYIYRDNRFLFINSQAEELTGYTHEELMQGDIWSFIHPDDRQRLKESAMARLAGGDVSSNFFARVLRKNGDVRDAEFFVDLVEFQEKTAILGIARDITEKKRADDALREREEQMRSLADNLPNGMIYQLIIEPGGKRTFTHVSAGVEKLHGVRAADAMSDASLLYNQIIPRDRRKLLEEEEKSLATLSVITCEATMRTRSGRERQVLIRSAPRRLTDGRIIWDGIELDITLLKLAEDELKAAYEQLTASQEELRSQFDALKESEDRTAESEEKYRTLVEHTDDGVFIARDGIHLFVNEAYAGMSGYSPAELTGMPFADLIAPEDREMVMSRHLARQDFPQVPDVYEFSILKKDGITRRRVKIRVGTGKYQGRPACIGTIRDVTDEREREAALRESEELHRGIIASIPDIIVRADLEGRIVFINERGAHLAGPGNPRDIIGKSIYSFIDPESMPAALLNIKKLLDQPVGPVEYLFRLPGGKRTLFEVKGAVLRTQEGLPYGMIFICRDITEQKEAEQALRRSEEEFRNILENMQDAFYRLDKNGVITMINPYAARAVGCDSPAEIVGKRMASEFYADPAEQDAFLSQLWEKKTVTGYPLSLVDAQGKLHYATASSRLIFDADNRFCGIEGILHDITPLVEARNALRQANRQITLMTSITRHDIKNQLMALNGWLELSMASVDEPERMKELIEKELRIAEIISQQINFTAVFDDMGVRPPAWQDPGVPAEKARAALPPGRARLETDLPDIEIYADPLLEKGFYNLFDNSLRYGGKTLTTIRLSSRMEGESFVLVIEDDGAGIPKQDKGRLFERGFGKNTGLGLFLVREVLSITGLAIRETGTFGEGARFEIIIPPGKFRARENEGR